MAKKKIVPPDVNAPAAPVVPVYEPKDGDIIARVYIEEKSVTAYKMPLVQKPYTNWEETKTWAKENWPAQPKTKLPDPFPELPNKARAYLKMAPYGDNIIINRKHIAKLLSFYMEIRELPLPDTVQKQMKEQMNLIRDMLNICTVDYIEEEWKTILKDSFTPLYPYYKCKCYAKKRNAKASPGNKALKNKKDEDE